MSRSLLAALLLGPLLGHAATLETADANAQEAERARAEVADQLQLRAYDLLDELVYGWLQEPLFTVDTPLVLADVTVPVGFGSGLQALLENHLVTLLVKNPRTHLQLSHCPQCTAMVVHSGARGTVVSRGVDQPEALAATGIASGTRHALFLDFEAEGSALVLRARITSLEPTLPITWAKTLSTTTAAPALLRSPEHLKSAAEARKEYLDLLEGKGLLLVPVRIGARTYVSKPDANLSQVPFVWVQLGLEASLSQARAWTAGFTAGFTWAPQSHVGWLMQVRVARLLTGSTVSLTHPDVYLFVGGAVVSISGVAALGFKNTLPTPVDLKNATDTSPNAIFGAFHAGLEMRLKNRLGVGVYVETAPALDDSVAVGNFLNLGLFKLHAFGFEVSLCF